MMKIIFKLSIDQKAQGLAEYSLILTLVVLAAIATLQLFGIKVENLYQDINIKVISFFS